MDYVIALIYKLISKLWTSIAFWRGLGLFFFFIFICAYSLRRKLLSFFTKPKHVAHDLDIFNGSNEMMDEDQLINFLDELEYDNSYHINKYHNIVRFCMFFEKEGNQYLKNELKEQSLDLISSLDKLIGFLKREFFVYPESQKNKDTRLCMQPRYAPDRGDPSGPKEVAQYRDLVDKLYELSGEVRKRYKEYRANVKKTLVV